MMSSLSHKVFKLVQVFHSLISHFNASFGHLNCVINEIDLLILFSSLRTVSYYGGCDYTRFWGACNIEAGL